MLGAILPRTVRKPDGSLQKLFETVQAIMISRSLLRQSLSNSSRSQPLSCLLFSARSSRASSHRPPPIPLTCRLPARCYSSKPESATEDSSSEGTPAAEGTQEEDPVRRELENKSQEIIELKVCFWIFDSSCLPVLNGYFLV